MQTIYVVLTQADVPLSFHQTYEGAAFARAGKAHLKIKTFTVQG